MAYLVQGLVLISWFYSEYSEGNSLQVMGFPSFALPFSDWSYLLNFAQLSITLSGMLFSRFHSDEHYLEWLALHRVFSHEHCLEWLEFVFELLK